MSVWMNNDESVVCWVDEKEMAYLLIRENRENIFGVDTDVFSNR